MSFLHLNIGFHKNYEFSIHRIFQINATGLTSKTEWNHQEPDLQRYKKIVVY